MIGVPSPAQQVTRIIRPPSNASAPPTPTQSMVSTIEDIPLEVMEYFNIDEKTIDDRSKKQIMDICKIINGEPLEVIEKCVGLSNRLGAPYAGETRYSKIWQYLKIQNNVLQLQKQMRAMEAMPNEFPSSTT